MRKLMKSTKPMWRKPMQFNFELKKTLVLPDLYGIGNAMHSPIREWQEDRVIMFLQIRVLVRFDQLQAERR